jgi:tetratricopeptide (TPR) repeat protein
MGCWLSAAAPAALPGEWRNDFSPAVQVAIQSGKQNLLLFTGLDWEQQSRRFRTEVLEKPEFARALSADFVLTHVDLPEAPRPEAELSSTEASHYTLARDFKLYALPSVFLCTADGRPYALIGYHEGGPPALLSEIAKKHEAYAAMVAKMTSLEGPARALAIDGWLQTLPESLRELHSDKVQVIIDSDPGNSTGLRSRYRLAQMLPRARSLRYDGNLEGAEKLYTGILKELRPTGEEEQDLRYELADVYFQRKDYDSLLAALDQAIAAAPNGPRIPVLKEMMDVFTRQWIYTKYDPDRMKALDYDHKRMEIPSEQIRRLKNLIEQAKSVAPTSTRNLILKQMETELPAPSA